MKKILGLDLGTNSIGWSLIHEAMDGTPKELIDCGVRIFIKAVEEKTPTPKNHKRRRARMARRLIQRRARRRHRLENYLIKLGLLPKEIKNTEVRESILNNIGCIQKEIEDKLKDIPVDPYFLRTKALDENLEPYELGRVLLHLVSRRGFQSNRKTLFSDMLDDPDVQELLEEMEREEGESINPEEREEGAFKQAIGELQQNIEKSNCRTLGEYLHKLPDTQRRRNRRTGREMYKHELALIMEKQAVYHSVLTDAVRQEIEHIIFFQRPLRTPKNTIGMCSLERKSRRAHIARLEFQHFRYLQDINHLRYDCETVDEKTGEILGLDLKLSDENRAKLIELLEKQKTATWATVKKVLGLPKKITFNLEESAKAKGLSGNHTACAIRAVIGEKWEALTADQQHALVEDLISYEKKTALKKRLVEYWQFEPRLAVQLITANLPDGYANLSLKAIRKLMPFMECGMRFDQARVAAGYTYETSDEEKIVERLPLPPQIRNPIVQKALFEVRRVVNAVIATYGKPDAIRIELPRELTMSAKQKKDHIKQQKDNERANDKAMEAYADIRRANAHLRLPERSAFDDRLKYRLWEEQGRVCLYTGKQISMTELFTSAIEIDHILPYSRTVNDSYLNKVVVFATANREKGNRTPYETYASDLTRWEPMIQRAKTLHPKKYKNIMQQELGTLDGFINSQLTDTAYISREVKNYVACLGCDVSVTKGIITGWLRRQWGLNTILGGDIKNRDDHRHHAVDATVTAITSRKLYLDIVHAAEHGRDKPIGDPWNGFRDELKNKLNGIIVSHAPVRKIVGAFHEETGYGVQENDKGGKRVVYRKILDDKFDKKQVSKVLDPHLRGLLEEHLEKFNGNSKAAFNEANRPRYGERQAPVRHIRIIAAENFNEDSHLAVRDSNGKPYRYHPFGNNHHVEILRHKKTGKINSIFVTAWEAAQRVRRDRRALIQTDHGLEYEFLMALCISDLVKIEVNGQEKYFRIQKLGATSNQIMLREHRAATLDNKNEEIFKTTAVLINEFKMHPLQISPLGHIRNDQASH